MTIADEAKVAAEPRRSSGLLHKTSIGTIALTASSALRLGLQLAMLPILARLIGPTEYGLVAMAMPAILFANVLSDGGMSYALGRRREVGPGLESTVFWLSGAIGAVIAVFCCAAAWPLGLLLGQPRLPWLVTALSPILLMNGLSAASNARIIREGRFSVFAGGDLLSAFAAAAAALAAATHGFGAWSLVAQQLALWLVKFAWVSFNGRIQLRPTLDLAEARELLGFGVHAIGASLADFVSRNVDNLIVGGILGSTALGFYAMAYQIVRVPDMLLTGPLYLYIFTALSRAAHGGDHRAVETLAVAAVRLASSAFAPLFCGLAMVADVAVPLVLGDKWTGAILPLQCLAGAGFFFCICALINATLMGLGQSGLQFRLSLALGVTTILVVSGAAPFGVTAVSASLIVGTGLICATYIHFLALHLKTPLTRFISAFRPAAIATTAMAAGLFVARRALAGLPPGLELFLLVGVGAVIYGATIMGLARRRLLEDARGFFRAQASGPIGDPAAIADPAPA